LATPYFQLRLERVPSTQDVAREHLGELPLLVVAGGQSKGRGRSGVSWLTADRALAASLAWRHGGGDNRPFSLMAGLAAIRSIPDSTLKWPNDVLVSGKKAGGILVERSADVTVVGFGLNLWWPDAGEGMTALHDADPGEHAYLEVGSLWGAHLMELIAADGWPIDEYREMCSTIGEDIVWEPAGAGRAVGVEDTGALVVETSAGVEALHSGAVRHVRPA
jgi:BirA family transcriptional regulator, biotin operon repressor / biotin---[acetyl-CoA-carboxylase] ligase